MSTQRIFDGIEFGFRWVGDWYEYDGKIAEKTALRARNELFSQLKAQGRAPRKFRLPMQLRSMGGIGSGRPHIELHTKAYGVEW
jgi:hypothetical protein